MIRATIISREGSKPGISTRFSFFFTYHFRITSPSYNKLFRDITYPSLALSRTEQTQRWETKFIAETEFTRTNSSTLMSIVRGLITRVSVIIIPPGMQWWFAVKRAGSLTKSRAAIIYERTTIVLETSGWLWLKVTRKSHFSSLGNVEEGPRFSSRSPCHRAPRQPTGTNFFTTGLLKCNAFIVP